MSLRKKSKSSKQNASAITVLWWRGTCPLLVCGDSRGRVHVVEFVRRESPGHRAGAAPGGGAEAESEMGGDDALMDARGRYLVRAHHHDVVPALAALPQRFAARGDGGGDEYVVLSGGHDGRIVAWDLRRTVS